MSITTDAARAISSSSRGAPRQVIARLLCARDAAQVGGQECIDLAAVQRALSLLGIDEEGLEAVERRALSLLSDARRPLSVAHLARLAGVSLRNWMHLHEPYLMMRGLLAITPRGRVAVGLSSRRQ